MPITHRIHHAQRLVVARCNGVLTDAEVFDYQRTVWADPALAGFNELIDMTRVTRIALPSHERVRDLANLSASMDAPGTQSKLAVIATSDLAYGLGQMYGARRDMNPKSTKQVEVFATLKQALEWLGVEEEVVAE